MIRVGYLGPEATFTNMAVSRFSGSRACTVSNDSRLYRSLQMKM